MDLVPRSPGNDETRDEYINSGPHALTATMSWGEQLLPLTYATMQCSWIAALLIGFGRLHMFSLKGTVMPLWAPFLIIITSTWCAMTLPDETVRTQKRQTFSLSQLRSSTMITILIQTVLILCIVWGTFYSTTALWNPIWLETFAYDLIQINNTAFGSVAIILITYGLSYHGIHIARYAMEPNAITRGLIIGGIIFAIVIIIQPISDLDQAALLLFLLLFFSLVLFAKALAHAIFIRQGHLVGLHGNKYTQDSLVMSSVGFVCLPLVIIALVVSLLINPALLIALIQPMSLIGKLYERLANVFVSFIVFLLSFISLGGKLKSNSKIQIPHNPAKDLKVVPKQIPTGVQTFASLLLVIIMIAIVAIVILVIVRILRSQRRARRVQRDQHESLWSWQLFWSQFKRWLLTLVSRFRTHEEARIGTEQFIAEEDMIGVNRDVRAIYRAFLQWATSRGFTRQRNETPYELQQRLHQSFMLLQPEIQTVTEIYTTARYSQVQPTEAEVERMEQNWNSLQQKSYEIKTE